MRRVQRNPWHGLAGQGMAQLGEAWQAWLGGPWLGRRGAAQLGRRGGAGRGEAGQGVVRRGLAWLGWARLGGARQGEVWQARRGRVWRGIGEAGFGLARLGKAMQGRQGWAGLGCAGHGEARQARPSGARLGMAGPGWARQGSLQHRKDTMTTTFRRIARKDGKSKAEVLVDLVKDSPPDTVFSYDQFAAALDEGSEAIHDRKTVQQVVAKTNRKLLARHQRCLRVIENVGYRVAHAREHIEIADLRTSKGRKQFKWALQTLENARLDEMTESQRAIHLAQLQINHQLHDEQNRIRRQLKRQGEIVAGLTHRVEQGGL